MTDHANAPIYALIPTHCSCCNRELSDGVSIEKGIGPRCRRKYAYEDAHDINNETAREVIEILSVVSDSSLVDRVSEAVIFNDSRKAVNLINHAVAIWAREDHEADVLACLKALRKMGYTKLAAKIEDRVTTVTVKVEAGRVKLVTPFNEAFIAGVRKIQGRRWEREEKVWSVPVAQKGAAWKLLQTHFSGTVGTGPKGTFTI